MKNAPNYHESHLVVAAVRILSHTEGKPPAPEEVAKMLGLTSEKVYMLARELKERDILRMLESPFDVRLDVLDPRPLESLPREHDDGAMIEELAEFKTKSREKHDEMTRMFAENEAEKRRKERVSKLEEQFKSFRPKPGQLDALFQGPDDEDSSAEAEAEDEGEETDAR